MGIILLHTPYFLGVTDIDRDKNMSICPREYLHMQIKEKAMPKSVEHTAENVEWNLGQTHATTQAGITF